MRVGSYVSLVVLLVIVGCSTTDDHPSTLSSTTTSQVPLSNSTTTSLVVQPEDTPASMSAKDSAVWELPLLATAPDGLPMTFVGVQADGTVVKIDTASGELAATFGQVKNDSPFDIRSWSIPGTEQVLVSSCCEPVSGNIFQVTKGETVATSSPRSVGKRGLPSPDGQAVLLVQPLQGLFIETAGGQFIAVIEDRGAGLFEVDWLKDRRGFVRVRATTNTTLPGERVLIPVELEVVELNANYEIVSTVTVQVPAELAATSVAAGDGVLFIAGCVDLDCTSSALLRIDTSTGELLDTTDLGFAGRLGGFDPTGHHLIAIGDDGLVRLVTANNRELAYGMNWASW